MRVACPYCGEWLVDEGFGLMETVWMHEYECSAIAMTWELAPDGEAGEPMANEPPAIAPPLAA